MNLSQRHRPITRVSARQAQQIATPHHTTRSAEGTHAVFFEEGDYALYRDLLADRCRKASVSCWAYCLMPNHVHLILVPAPADGLARAIGETHRQHTGEACPRLDWG